jgi:hypothetical protein
MFLSPFYLYVNVLEEAGGSVMLNGLSFFGEKLAYYGHFFSGWWLVVSGQSDLTGSGVFEKADMDFWKMIECLIGDIVAHLCYFTREIPAIHNSLFPPLISRLPRPTPKPLPVTPTKNDSLTKI